MYSNFPIEKVRAEFPALKRTYNGKQVVYLDGPAGSQACQGAIDAINDVLCNGNANMGGVFPTSQEVMKKIRKTREDIAVLFNAKADEVAFGQNATSLMFAVGRALALTWNEGDEIILTEIEHHSNVDAWKRAAEDRGVIVKYIPLDPKTLTLDLDVLPDLLSEKTRLVAICQANNVVGTITDIKPISKLVRETNALLVVDAVHAIPHLHVDMVEEGIDILFSSAYKFFAAHVGMAIIKEDIFEKLNVYKLVPAPAYIPDKLETGTQNHESIPSISAAIDFIARLGEGDTLKEKIKSGYHNIEEYENHLADIIRKELRKLDTVILYESPEEVAKTPTIAFRVEGIEPLDFCTRMCEEHSVFIAAGHFYASTLAEKLGIIDKGSFIRAGIAPYNTEEEVNRFITGVKEIINTL